MRSSKSINLYNPDKISILSRRSVMLCFWLLSKIEIKYEKVDGVHQSQKCWTYILFWLFNWLGF